MIPVFKKLQQSIILGNYQEKELCFLIEISVTAKKVQVPRLLCEQDSADYDDTTMTNTADKSQVARYVRRLEFEARRRAHGVYWGAVLSSAVLLVFIAVVQLTAVGRYVPFIIKLVMVGLLFIPVVYFLRSTDALDHKARLVGWGAEAEEAVNDALAVLTDLGRKKWKNKKIRNTRGGDLDVALKSPRGRFFCIEVKADYRRAAEEDTQRQVIAQAAKLRETTKSRYYV